MLKLVDLPGFHSLIQIGIHPVVVRVASVRSVAVGIVFVGFGSGLGDGLSPRKTLAVVALILSTFLFFIDSLVN